MDHEEEAVTGSCPSVIARWLLLPPVLAQPIRQFSSDDFSLRARGFLITMVVNEWLEGHASAIKCFHSEMTHITFPLVMAQVTETQRHPLNRRAESPLGQEVEGKW